MKATAFITFAWPRSSSAICTRLSRCENRRCGWPSTTSAPSHMLRGELSRNWLSPNRDVVLSRRQRNDLAVIGHSMNALRTQSSPSSPWNTSTANAFRCPPWGRMEEECGGTCPPCASIMAAGSPSTGGPSRSKRDRYSPSTGTAPATPPSSTATPARMLWPTTAAAKKATQVRHNLNSPPRGSSLSQTQILNSPSSLAPNPSPLLGVSACLKSPPRLMRLPRLPMRWPA